MKKQVLNVVIQNEDIVQFNENKIQDKEQPNKRKAARSIQIRSPKNCYNECESVNEKHVFSAN